ncbi:MAG: glycosyltransferase [Nakamurella sp.]
MKTTIQTIAPRVWCTEIDLGGEVPGTLPTPADQAPYESARVLIRLHGESLMFVERPVVDGSFALGDVVTGLATAARSRLDVHLAEDGGSVEIVDGVAYVHAPWQCSRTRPAGPSMTVVVCTRGRGEALRSCLAQLARMDYPGLDFVIVDNAPVDDSTRTAFLGEVGEDARFRYVVEPRPGLSCARNRGLAEARGELIAYTDDDVSVDPQWADSLITGFLRREDVACVTSLVCTASLETPAEYYFDARVSWATRCEPRVYDSVAPDGDLLYPYSAGLFGTGAGMAFRTAVIRELGGFDEALGAGTRTAGGEDLDAFVKVLQDGHAIAYEPSSVVWHHHRADLKGLQKQMYAYGTGLTAFLTKHLLDRDTRGDLLRRIPKGIAKLALIPRTTKDSVEQAPAQSEISSRMLLLREFTGMAMGPFLYGVARRRIPTELPPVAAVTPVSTTMIPAQRQSSVEDRATTTSSMN